MSLNSVPIEVELRKNCALKRSDLDSLKQWCDEKLYPNTYSDLALFLHSNYYYLEMVKLNIENYYVTRQSLPQFFENRVMNSEELKNIFDELAIIPLAKRTREGYKVILIRPLDVVKNNILSADAIKLFNMVLDLNINEEGTHNGYVFVVDVHGSNFIDSKSFDAVAVKKYFDYLQKSAPIRWFGLHFVNTVLPFTQGDQFTRMTIVQNDYVDAVYFHLDMDSLNEVVPLHVLPNELGGNAGTLKDLHEAQVSKLQTNWLWFSMMESQEALARVVRDIKEEKLSMNDMKTEIQGTSNAPLAV